MKLLYYYIPIHLVLLCLISSCSQNCQTEDKDNDNRILTFRLPGTKTGAGTDTTYRVIIFNSTGLAKLPGTSGTYRKQKIEDGVDWLIPCKVDNSGAWVKDSMAAGVRFFSTVLRAVSLVSPAVMYRTDKANPNGYFLNRDRAEGEQLYLSNSFNVIVMGNSMGNMPVYDVPDDIVLTERRSKLTVSLKCGEDIVSASVDKVWWESIYSRAFYHLGQEAFTQLTLSEDSVFIYNGTTPKVLNNGDAPDTLTTSFFLFPLNYSKIQDGAYVYSVPEIHLEMGTRDIAVTLPYEFCDQYEYGIEITINSAYAQVEVTSSPWVEGALYTQETSVEDLSSQTSTFSYTVSWVDTPGSQESRNAEI